MGKKLEPDTLSPFETEKAEVEELNQTNQGAYRSTVRWISSWDHKERIEAEEVIRSLTERDESQAKSGLLKLVAWLLALLANFSLLILILYGAGVIKLPTALVFAVVGPLLSGVLGLLGLLVKYLTR